jgi:hypothetical protein
MLKISGDSIERSYVDEWAQRLGLHDLWMMILAQVG